MRRFPVLCGWFVLLAPLALAQSPQLLATDPEKPDQKPHPITLSKADVHLLIAGRLCQTSMTLTFFNDSDRVLEGELVFPLPENAAVSGYALDVNRQLVDAVTIERDKARVVFESETRRGIDPGIVEQVQGNNFRTRVHPIPAKGARTIRVQYVSEPLSRGDQLVYALPIHWPGAAPAEVMVRVESFSAAPPRVEAIPDLKFESADEHHIGQRRIEKPKFDREVVATLPAAASPATVVEKHTQSTVSVENLDPKAAEQFSKTEFYFVANDAPRIDPQTTTATRAQPGRIGIAWDASLSRGGIDHAKEFELIKAHLAALGDVGLELTVFRNTAEPTKGFLIQKGDASELIKYLSALAYDGGTNLSAVALTKDTPAEPGINQAKTPPAIAYYLLFTDGLSNLGPDLPAKVEVPVYAISNDPRSNHNLLRRLSTTSGGQYINLQTLTAEQAVGSLIDSPFSLISIDSNPKEVDDLYPRLPQPVQGRVTVAGRLLARTAKITLNYGRNGAITQRVPVTLTQDGATGGGNLVSRFWAQLKLADLSAAPDRNEGDITALGKQFNLVTPYTSMIVLENVEQYLRYKIVPPKSRGDVYVQFMDQIEKQQVAVKQEEKAKIDRVVAMWNARLAWWNQEFKYAADFKYEAPEPAKPAATVAAAIDSERAGEARSRQAELATRDPAPSTGQPVADRAPAAPALAPASTTPSDGSIASNPAQQGQDAGGATSFGAGFSGRQGGAGGAPRESLGDSPANHQLARRVEYEDVLRYPENWPDARSADGLMGGLPRPRGRGEVATQRAYVANLDAGTEAYIKLKEWSADSPYLKALRAAPAADAYGVYLQQRKAYESSPAFYLDCADFFAQSNPDLALRILTNIPELALDDGRLLRIAAHRLQQLGQLDLAIDLFERVTKLRPEEPQSFRDLALALVDRADAFTAHHDIDRARSDYERSVQLLHKVVMNHWDRFDEIEVIALTEANRILSNLSTQDSALRTISNPFDSRLIKLLDPDLRIVMTWDTDNTDIDLHVTEPTGETCVYNHNRTSIGGALSKDFTQGYGPEEYVLRKLMPGQYKIQAHFYGSRDQKLIGPTTVQATVITHYGRPDEKRQSITLRLKDAKDMVDVGTVTLK
jgi:Ca-activated chloride channel family protein